MVKRVIASLGLLIGVLSVSFMGGADAQWTQSTAEATVSAYQTQVAKLQTKVDKQATSIAKRDSKIHAQQTQIADLKSQLPVVNEDPAIGDVFAISNFELTVQATNVQPTVGDYDPSEANGIYLVIYIDVKNVSDRPLTFPYDDFTVVDGRGRTFSLDQFAEIKLLIYDFKQMSSMNQEMQPGVIASTGLIFDVPADATGFTLTNARGDFKAPLDR